MVATDPTYGGGSRASVIGQTYNSIFDWMSAQTIEKMMITFLRKVQEVIFNQKDFIRNSYSI
ncbi:MAG: hypothetical protein ACLU93_06840 [Streptococcus sp.]